MNGGTALVMAGGVGRTGVRDSISMVIASEDGAAESALAPLEGDVVSAWVFEVVLALWSVLIRN